MSNTYEHKKRSKFRHIQHDLNKNHTQYKTATAQSDTPPATGVSFARGNHLIADNEEYLY